MLNHLDTLGIKNLYILPHYDGPNGDAGYDISDYEPTERYSGMAAFRKKDELGKLVISRRILSFPDVDQTLLRLLGSDSGICLADCRDPRELQRGPVPAQTFYQALKEAYPATELISRLNLLRKRHSALRSSKLAAVDTYDERLFGMLRFPEEPAGQGDYPFLALSNLCEQALRTKTSFV